MSIEIAPTLDDVGQRRPAGRDRYDEACAASARSAIEHWMQDEGITTYTAAARALQVDPSALSKNFRKEAPTQPSMRTLIALSRLTGRSLDAILGLRSQEARPREVGDKPLTREDVELIVRRALDGLDGEKPGGGGDVPKQTRRRPGTR